MKYPNAIGPALRLYGRVLKAHWPMLLALTVAYPLLSWGASLAWKVPPVATSWVELGLKGVQTLVWAVAWGLMGAMLAQLTLATVDRRPAGLGALLRACASALPVVVLLVLLADVTSLPLSLWRYHLATSESISEQTELLLLLTFGFTALDLVVFWLLVMAVPIRVDRDFTVRESVTASARLARRRWKSVLLVLLLTGAGLVAVGIVWQTQVFGRLAGPDGNPPAWLLDSYLLKAVTQALSMAWMLFWPALYVVFRDQEESGGVAAAFD